MRPLHHILICANPISGRGRGMAAATHLQQVLQAARFRVVISDSPPEQLNRQWILVADAVVIIGGDGTIRSTVDRLIQIAPADALPPVLVVPMGTANLLAQHLGIDWGAGRGDRHIVESLRAGRTVTMDAARVNGRLFLLMVGVGVDAQVVHWLEMLRSGPIVHAHYLLPAALTLAAYEFPPISVDVDGIELASDVAGIAMIGNVREYGTGFAILPDARPDDGLLDVCIIPCQRRGQLLKILLQAASGDHLLREGVRLVRGRHIEVRSNAVVPVQVDGDAAGFTPAVIDLLPFRLPFIVPAFAPQS